MKKKLLEIVVPVVSAVIIVVVVGIYWQHKKQYPGTDDAYVGANVIQVAAQVTGRVDSVGVIENQYVKQSQLLFSIDPRPYQLAVDKANAALAHIYEQLAAQQMAVNSARARVAQAEAELVNAKAIQRRTSALVKKGYMSMASGDSTKKDLQVAEASVTAAKNQLLQSEHERGELGANNAELKSAESALNKAKLDLSYTVVRAPKSGFIQNISLRLGASITAYQPQFALVEDEDWWVDANFKETQLERIRVGQPVKIQLDMYPHHNFMGVVESLSSSSGSSFSLLPAQNASGNWVKVTQRFPVRIKIKDTHQGAYPLRNGASSTVTVDTRDPVA